MQQEMIRLHRGEENALEPLVEKVFGPMMPLMFDLFFEGKRTGELIEVDEWQLMYAALGANAFYFLSAPVMRIVTGKDPLEPRAMEARRKAAVEYLGQTIFVDRRHGAEVAARVLGRSPMPRGAEVKTGQDRSGQQVKTKGQDKFEVKAK
jgi:TetR/AcrR family transcriptional regulator